MNFGSVIKEAVSSISSVETSRKILGEKLRSLKQERISASGEVFEEKLAFPIKKPVLNTRIAGVDSGFVSKKLFMFDLVFVRAVGVLFEYRNSVVSKADYFPNFFSFPAPFFSNHALELDEFNCSQSIVRLGQEISTGVSLIEKHSPDYLFLDGSIIPQYADKPRKDSKVKSSYHSLIQSFEGLYETAEKNNCRIVACVEDSRGSRFRTLLQDTVLNGNSVLHRELLDDSFDAVLLDYFLDAGERSMAFKYSSEAKKHPILEDFSEKWRDRVFACYLKPAVLDRPLRIEFLHDNKRNLTEEANELAGIVFAISSLHREYAYPSVLIEADLHARLKNSEIDIVYSKIVDKLGKRFQMKMRRDSRPF